MMISINEPFFASEAIEDIRAVLDSKKWVAGRYVQELEGSLCRLSGLKYGVAVANATVAIELAIQCLNPHPDAEIITPSFTYKSAVTAIMRAGCKPIFCDINSEYVIDIDQVRNLVTENTIAIIGTDMFGYPCDSKRIRALANDVGIDFIEDAAQAIGAKIFGDHVGKYANMTIISFYATKNIGAGEGGMILTDDPILYDRALRLREANIIKINSTYGVNMLVGSNLRMSEITAPLAIHGIKNISNAIASRRQNAIRMQKYLDMPHPHFVPGRLSSWNTFPILHQDRDGLISFCQNHNIQLKPYYDYLVNYDPVFQEFCGVQETPRALEVSGKIVSLPIHHNLSDIQLQYIAEKVKSYESAAR